MPEECLEGWCQHATGLNPNVTASQRSMVDQEPLCAKFMQRIRQCRKSDEELSLCSEYHFEQCMRPKHTLLRGSTLGQRTEAECQDFGNKQFTGQWSFYTFNKIDGRCTFYYIVKLNDYIATCGLIYGSPKHSTRTCLRPMINTCNAFGKVNCDKSWDTLESKLSNQTPESCRKACNHYKSDTCTHFVFNVHERTCNLIRGNRGANCDLVFGPPKPAFNHCFPSKIIPA